MRKPKVGDWVMYRTGGPLVYWEMYGVVTLIRSDNDIEVSLGYHGTARIELRQIKEIRRKRS
jgi:hypothetical protein